MLITNRTMLAQNQEQLKAQNQEQLKNRTKARHAPGV